MKRCSCVALAILFVTSAMATDNWPRGWEFRQKITIDHTVVSNNLADFPVLITEGAVHASLFTNALANGGDILFSSSNGVTTLSHEIEHYDAVAEEIAAWVKLPALSKTVDTDLYIYYGNPGATDLEDATNVWGNGYVGVWHLGEQSGTNRDSTVSANHATTNGIVNMTATGRVDGADSVTGSGHLDLGVNEAGLGMDANSFTVSIWYKKVDPTGDHIVIAGESNGGATAYRGFSLFVTGTSLYGRFADSALTRNQLQVGGDGAGAWHQAVLVRDKDAQTVSLYYDGAPKSSLTSIVGHTVTATQIDIGAANGGQRFKGSLDETRISLGVRTADWIATEYNNQSDPGSFAASAGEEVYVPSGTTVLIH